MPKANHNNIKKLQSKLPRTKSDVPGFSIKIKRKYGCVIKGRPADSPDETPFTDYGVEGHFEVTVTCSDNFIGAYEVEGPWSFILTNELRDYTKSGFIKRVHYQPFGDTFTKVEVIEELENYRNMGMMGRSKQEYIVWVNIHITHPDGSTSYSKCGVTSRVRK